jgi:hypothetical protein
MKAINVNPVASARTHNYGFIRVNKAKANSTRAQTWTDAMDTMRTAACHSLRNRQQLAFQALSSLQPQPMQSINSMWNTSQDSRHSAEQSGLGSSTIRNVRPDAP